MAVAASLVAAAAAIYGGCKLRGGGRIRGRTGGRERGGGRGRTGGCAGGRDRGMARGWEAGRLGGRGPRGREEGKWRQEGREARGVRDEKCPNWIIMMHFCDEGRGGPGGGEGARWERVRATYALISRSGDHRERVWERAKVRDSERR